MGTFSGMGGGESMLAAVNARLSVAGISITREDAEMLLERRNEILVEAGRVEFGQPAIAAIAEVVAFSPCCTQENAAVTLAELQDAFYRLRDELPVHIPDDEIIEALRGCLDEHGDAAEVASMHAEEVMAFCGEYRLAQQAEGANAYSIVDDDGRMYVFDSSEWAYDEQADGWDGERWSDDWDD